MLEPLGPLRVTTPGTLVPVSTIIPASFLGLIQNPAQFKVHAVLFQALPTNLGLVYIGKSGLVRATFAQCLAVLAVPTTNSIPAFSVALTIAPSGIELSDLYLDAAQGGEGVLVSVLVT